MTREEARRIMEEEALQGYRFFEDRPYKADEVVIAYSNKTWQVYVTSERCAMIESTLDIFESESEALESFIDRLRADKILRELL